jgi:hypothetical protein
LSMGLILMANTKDVQRLKYILVRWPEFGTPAEAVAA